jgi:hypothetical protein
VLFTRPPQLWGGRFFWLSLTVGEEAMTQNELNRAVARATGESVSVISGMGFVPLTSVPREREPRTIDWDEVQQGRRIAFQPRRKRPAFVA